MARKGRIEIGASVTVGAKEDGSLSAIEKRIEELSDKEIEIKISDAAKDLKELEKMEKKVGGNIAASIAARRKELADSIELYKQEQKLRADGLKQMNQEVKVAKELQKVEKKRIETKEKKNNEPTKRERELIDITRGIKGIRGVVNVFDDPSIEKTEERLRKLNDALDEYQVKLDAMKRLRKGNERTMYDTAKSEIADLKRALSAIQAVKDQTPTIKPKMEKKEKEVEQEKPKKTNVPTPKYTKDPTAEGIQQQASATKELEGATKTASAATNKQTEALQKQKRTMQDFLKLWGEVSKKYSAEDFGKKYGRLMEAVSGESPIISIDEAYDELERREKERQKELDAESRKRAAITAELNTLNSFANPILEEIHASKKAAEEYANVIGEITMGALSGADAIERLRKAMQGAREEQAQAINPDQIQGKRLQEIYEIAKQNRNRDLKKDQPNSASALSQRISELQTIIPQLKELQAEVSQMNIVADGVNFKSAFAAAAVLAEAIANKEKDLKYYNSTLETTIKLEEFAAKASEKYGITKRSKKFSADVMSEFKQLMVDLQNGLSIDDAMARLDKAINIQNPIESSTEAIQTQTNAIEQQASATQTLTEANNELAESYLKVQETAKKSLDVTDGSTFATILKYYKELLKAPQDNEIVAAQKALIEKAFNGAKSPDQLNALQYADDSELTAMGNKLMLGASFEGEFLFSQISAYLQDIVGSTIDWGKTLGVVEQQAENVIGEATQGISTIEEGVDLSSRIFDALKQIRELKKKRHDIYLSNDDAFQKLAKMDPLTAAIDDIQEKQFPYIAEAFYDEDFNSQNLDVESRDTDEMLRKMANSIATYATTAKENLGDLKLIKIDTSNVVTLNGELKDICDNSGKAVEAYRGLANEISTTGLATSGHHSGATWFSTKKDVAAGYARGTDNIYRANLQARRLLDIDANKSSWNNITFLGDGSDDMSKKMIELYNKKKELEKELGRIFDEDRTLESPRYQDAEVRLRKIKDDYEYYSRELNNPYGTNETNWYVKYAKKNGYDAVRIKNVYDTLGSGGLSDVIGVLSQEQIANVEKVATVKVEPVVEQGSPAKAIQESTGNQPVEVPVTPVVEQTGSVRTVTDTTTTATDRLVQGIQQVGEVAQQTSQQLEQQTASNNALAESTERVGEAARQSAQQIGRQTAATNGAVSQNNKNIIFGSPGETYANGKTIGFKYAVMSVDSLTMSHNAYGQKNPNYPTELQPRDRSRIISVDQILKIAANINPSLLTSSPTAQNGSPIVSKDGIVIGGNARSAALAKAYESGQADAYRAYIKEHASEFGLNPNNMPNNPVLVRVPDIEDNLDVLARQLNESTNAGYSATEQAFALVESVMQVISKLNLDESANLNSQANRDFVTSLVRLLPDNLKNEMLTKDTELSAVGVTKVKQALMAAAYDSRAMLENLEQASPELINISNALMASAAKAADIRHSVESGALNDLGVVSTILNGVDLLKVSRSKNQTIGEYLDQPSMFGQDYAAEDVAIGKFFEANVRNTAQLRNMIDTILDFARSAGDPNQISFEGIKEITLADIIRNAFTKHAEAYQKNINYDELTGRFLPAEAGSRSDKRAISQRRIIEQQTEPPVVPIQPSVTPGTVEGAIQESTGGDEVEVPVKPVVAKERLSIIERNEDNALEALRNAKDNKTNLVDLSNVYSTGDLKGQLESMAAKITDNKKIPLSVGDIKINDSIAAVTMYNEALGITYRQLYKVSEAADDASKSQLELWSESYDENYKAAQKYSEAQKKKIAQDDKWLIGQASKLNTQERNYKYSGKKIKGTTILTDAGDTSLAEGANRTIDSLAEHIKNQIQSAMGQGLTNEVRNQIINDLRILDNEIKIEQYKQWVDKTMKPTEVEAAKKDLEYTLQSLEAKAKKNNVFSQIEENVISLREQLNSINEGTQFSKFIDDLRTTKSKLNAEIAKEQTTKKEEQNYQNLINLQNRLYEAKKKLNDLEIKGQLNTAEGQQASRKVEDLQKQYDLSLKLLQNEENRRAIEERGNTLDTEMSATKNKKQIEQYYQNIYDTVNRINDLSSQINTLKVKDGGKGIYSDLIMSLENEKSALLNKIDQIGADVNQYFNGVFTSVGDADSIKLPIDTLLKDTDSYNIISNFLNDVGVRASLSADQINKLAQAFYDSSKAGADFVSKINGQFKSAEDAFSRLQQLVSTGALDAENEQYKIITNVFNKLSEMNNDPNKDKWTANQIAGFTALSERLKEYSNDLSNAAEQEAKYFAGKLKARSGITMFNDDGGKGALVKKDQADAGYGENIDTARTKLEAFVQEYTKGQGIITSFNTAANGISKVNFSVFDEATGKIRTFTAEVGKLNNQDVFYSETSMKNLTVGTDAAMKSLESISQTIARLQDIKGAENEIERLKQLAVELRDKINEIGSSEDSSDQNTLKNIATDADNAIKSANKLGEALLKVQRAISGESLKDFDVNVASKTIDTIDQMIARLKQIDSTDGTVSKLKEQLLQIQSALSAPDINTDAGKTKLRDVLTDTEKLIKEVQYFANKKQYANISNLQDYDKTANNMDAMAESTRNAKQALEEYVNGFEGGKKIITGFTTSANGISKINFAMFEEGTNQFRTFSAEMGQFSNNIYPYETSMKNLTSGTDAAMKSLSSLSTVMSRLKGIEGTEDIRNNLRKKMEELSDAMNAPDASTAAGQTKLKNLATDAERAVKSASKLEQQWIKTQDVIDGVNVIDLGRINKNGDIQAQMLNKIQTAANGAKVTVTGFDQTTNTLTYTLTNADGTVTTMTAHMHELNGAVTTQQGETKKLTTGWQEFTGGINGALKTLGQYVGRMISVWAIVGQLKKGFSAVKEIDAALTELKKVTDETEASYRNFLNTASKTAGTIGSTVSDFTTASANFARLGYTMEESAKMAETAIVYKNVAD